jgi:hypothetical protein
MKNVNFAIREMWELYSLDFLISEFKEFWINWNIYVIPYNSDLEILNTSSFLEEHLNVNIINWSDWTWPNCIWFKTDISSKTKDGVSPEIDIYRLASCINMLWSSSEKKYDIVVSNVKINDKNSDKEYDSKMWDLLWKLPYTVAVVPRHPFPKNFLHWIDIPKNVTIINKVWVLKELCKKTSLVVMWLIFSNTEWEMDHSPLEATINSNAISWSFGKIEDAYKDFYNNNWLIHKYNTFWDSIKDIPTLINDSNLKEKLEKKENRIKSNREEYLPKVLNILLKS